MKAYKHLVKHALNTGHTVSVFDNEVWQVKARVIQTAWEAMARVVYHDSDDAPKLIAAAADALAELK
jgi:hypothetical protein